MSQPVRMRQPSMLRCLPDVGRHRGSISKLRNSRARKSAESSGDVPPRVLPAKAPARSAIRAERTERVRSAPVRQTSPIVAISAQNGGIRIRKLFRGERHRQIPALLTAKAHGRNFQCDVSRRVIACRIDLYDNELTSSHRSLPPACAPSAKSIRADPFCCSPVSNSDSSALSRDSMRLSPMLFMENFLSSTANDVAIPVGREPISIYMSGKDRGTQESRTRSRPTSPSARDPRSRQRCPERVTVPVSSSSSNLLDR